jgi:serine/threonine protein kinase
MKWLERRLHLVRGLAIPTLALQSPSAPTEPTSDAVPRRSTPAQRDEVTRPVDMPVAREHGLSGRLLMGTDLRLDASVGRGSSALVYRATRARGGLPVAVKVLHSRSLDAMRQRFNREVEILRQVDSPGVVKVAGRGVLADGRPWYAMEYVEGHSLAHILDTAPCTDPARVVGWLRSACRGLAAIHEAGWVHRDVKPANLVVVSVGAREGIKIIDLGIAERIHARPDMLSGTPEYIAPEQAELRPADVRSDIYGLGCCAYELLSGLRLVEGGTSTAKLLVHTEGVRPRWPRGQGIPYELRRLVERCLARRPEARPPNMHALEAELERVAVGLVRTDMPRRDPLPRSELHIPTRDPNAPVRPRGRSWSSLASTVLAAIKPRLSTG